MQVTTGGSDNHMHPETNPVGIRTRSVTITRLFASNRLITARAFELSRWRGGRYRVVGPSIVARVRFGSPGGYGDPSQEADAA